MTKIYKLYPGISLLLKIDILIILRLSIIELQTCNCQQNDTYSEHYPNDRNMLSIYLFLPLYCIITKFQYFSNICRPSVTKYTTKFF